MQLGSERLFGVHPWKIIDKQFRPQKNEVAEAIFSLANEYMGTRGNFEEGVSDHTLEGCYLGGIFVKEKNVYPWKRKAFPTFSNYMVHTTNWLRIRVEVDGETFTMDQSEFSDYYRELDMQQGVLTRRLIFKAQSGAETELQWQRFVSHSDKHIAAVRLKIKAINHEKEIKVTLLLDSERENRDCATSIQHCRVFNKKAGADETYLLMKVDTTGQYYIHQMRIDTHDVPKQNEEHINDERLVGYRFSFTPEKGKDYCIDKIVSAWTSRDAGCIYGLVAKDDETYSLDTAREKEITDFLITESQSHFLQTAKKSYDQLLGEHTEKVRHLWDNFDIEIDGDDTGQQGIRFCIFQMLCTYIGNDPYLNINPKGFTGEHYWGRAFWDSESYCLPFYLFSNHNAAKNLVQYRYHTLKGAVDRAKDFGCGGAMYPMTTIDGTEDCNYWQYSFCEIHITSAVAYAIYLYDHIVNDKDYLYSKGIEVLVEVARYWATRSCFVPHRKGYAINRVIGPDEWQQFVNNNYYTNYTAKWAIKYAIDVLDAMKASAKTLYDQILAKAGLNDDELKSWQKVADDMILEYDEQMDVYVQDDMLFSMDPIAREQLDRERDIPVEAKWTIDQYFKVQLLKQPDILLMMFLFRDRFSLHEKKQNYRFYEQRTAHGSSLSPCIHSILASEIGRHNQAYDYYLWSARLDLDNCNNNTHEGLHTSSMAGTWLNIVCGFGGMVYTSDMPQFSPTIPDAWKKYSFKLLYGNSVIKLTVDRKAVTYQLVSGEPLAAKLYGSDIIFEFEPKTAVLADEFLNRPKLKAVIFDLDGVIVDTARLHYKAWKTISDAEGIYFDEKINERLKGVSRMDSLNIIMENANRAYSTGELEQLAEQKNNLYVQMLDDLTHADILDGIDDFIGQLREKGLKLALYSASKNTDKIVDHVGVRDWFDVVVTGNDVTRPKPDPQGLMLISEKLGIAPADCVVIEDAFAGLEAAGRAGMKAFGIGDKTLLYNSDYCLPQTNYLRLEKLLALY